MAELPLALHPNEQAQQARYGNVAGALQVTALLAHRSVEDIQANREILCRPVPLSLIYQPVEKRGGSDFIPARGCVMEYLRLGDGTIEQS
jgi:hypothetical protein